MGLDRLIFLCYFIFTKFKGSVDMKKYNNWVHLSMWTEFEGKYDFGIMKDFDTSGYYQDIIAKYNPTNKVDENFLRFFNNGISISIVFRLNGTCDIIQISGYHNRKGMICYLVDEEGNVTKV